MFFGEPEPVFNSPEISPPWPSKFSPHRPRECVHCFNIFFTTVFSWCRGCSFFFGEGNILGNSQYYGTFRTKAESGQENFPKADSPCWFPAMDQPHGSRDFPHGRPGLLALWGFVFFAAAWACWCCPPFCLAEECRWVIFGGSLLTGRWV